MKEEKKDYSEQAQFLVDEIIDDDGNYTLGKNNVFFFKDFACSYIHNRVRKFIEENNDIIEPDQMEVPTLAEVVKCVDEYGYFCYMIGEGSSDKRIFFRVIRLVAVMSISA